MAQPPLPETKEEYMYVLEMLYQKYGSFLQAVRDALITSVLQFQEVSHNIAELEKKKTTPTEILFELAFLLLPLNGILENSLKNASNEVLDSFLRTRYALKEFGNYDKKDLKVYDELLRKATSKAEKAFIGKSLITSKDLGIIYNPAVTKVKEDGVFKALAEKVSNIKKITEKAAVIGQIKQRSLAVDTLGVAFLNQGLLACHKLEQSQNRMIQDLIFQIRMNRVEDYTLIDFFIERFNAANYAYEEAKPFFSLWFEFYLWVIQLSPGNEVALISVKKAVINNTITLTYEVLDKEGGGIGEQKVILPKLLVSYMINRFINGPINIRDDADRWGIPELERVIRNEFPFILKNIKNNTLMKHSLNKFNPQG